MKLAKEKVDLTWLNKEEYEVLEAIWSKSDNCSAQWTTSLEEFGFRRSCHTEKGRGMSLQRIYLTVCQDKKVLQVEINNPGTGMSATAMLPFAELIPSPRQFQKLVFSLARGDRNTISASKTNLRIVWKEFLEAIAKMPVVERSEVYLDNSDWLE